MGKERDGEQYIRIWKEVTVKETALSVFGSKQLIASFNGSGRAM
jgi:hypothetical protein